MASCPPPDALIGLLDNGKPDSVRSSLFDHVSRCVTCRERLRHIANASSDGTDTTKQTSVMRAPYHGPALGADKPSAGTVVMAALPEVPGFAILSEIGRGGMGVVYMARDTKLNRTTALKMVLVGHAADPTSMQRFLFEAEVLARVHHPQVVQVYEVGTSTNYLGMPVPYLAMEYLDGGTLHAYLRKTGPLDPRAAAELIEGLALAVHAVHSQGVIHRDLKPANILRGDDGTFKVSDFGLAKLTNSAGSSELTATGTIVGTPAYMSPEQASGLRTLGPATDIYSLGAVLYEVLSGRPPYPGEDPVSVLLQVIQGAPPDVRTLRPKVPRNLAAVTMRALARDPARRYPTAEALAQDLRRFLGDRPTVARPVSRAERFGLWVRRNPAVTFLLVAVFAVSLSGLGLLVFSLHSANERADEQLRSKRNADHLRAGAEAARASAVGEKDRAEAALAKETEARELAGRRQAYLEFDQAVNWCEAGELERGLSGFQRTIDLAARSREPELERVARLNVAMWTSHLVPRVHSLPGTRGSRSVAYSHDGKYLATGFHKSMAQVWNADSGALLGSFVVNLQHLSAKFSSLGCMYWSVAMNRSNTLLAAGGSDGRVWLWQVPPLGGAAKPPTVTTVDAWDEGKSEDVWAVTFDPAGRLWTAASDGKVRVWDLASPARRKLVGEITVVADGRTYADVQALVLSPDGDVVYTGDRKGLIAAWSTHTLKGRTLDANDMWVQDLAVSPDGRLLAATVASGAIKVLDVRGPKPAVVFEKFVEGSQANALDFAADGRHLFVGDGDGNTRVWDVQSGLQFGTLFHRGGDVKKVRARPGTATVAIASGGDVEVVGIPAHKPTDVPLPPLGWPLSNKGLNSLGFSPDGKQLLTVHGQVPLRVELTDPPRPLAPDRNALAANAAAFGPDGRSIYALDDYNLTTVDLGFRPLGPPSPVAKRRLRNYSIVAAPAGDRLVIFDDTGVYFRAAGGDWKTVRTLLGSTERYTAVALHPRDPEVLVASEGRAEFVHPTTRAAVRPGLTAADDIFAAAYSPDGTRVLLGERNNAAEVCDLATGKTLHVLRHNLAVVAVTWSRDGSVMLTGSRDSTARFWDAATGLQLGPSLRHPAPVTAVAYSPNGDRVATSSKSRRSFDTHLYLWATPPTLPAK